MKAITLYDVARVAGVSYQTVSRVINDAEHVSARTREKVRQAMAALHYVPNRGAQQLAGKRTRTLGLMTSDLALHAPSQIASAVKSRAVEQGAGVLISMVEQPAQCQAALQELLAQRVEALLVNVPLEDAQAEMLQEMASPTPVLFLDVSPQLGLTASFSMLNRALARGGASAFAGAPANCAARRAGKFCLCPGSPGGMENYAGSGWRGGVCGGAGRLERGFRLRERSSALGGRTAAGGDPCGERSDGAWRFTRLCGKRRCGTGADLGCRV